MLGGGASSACGAAAAMRLAREHATRTAVAVLIRRAGVFIAITAISPVAIASFRGLDRIGRVVIGRRRARLPVPQYVDHARDDGQRCERRDRFAAVAREEIRSAV